MNPLAQWDALKNAIDQAHSVIDLKAIRDQAEAYRYALKLAGEAPEYLRKAEIIKVRAERRAGELIQVMPKQRPGEYKRSEGATVQTLEEQGIDKRDASKWQKIASIPEKDFEEWIEKAPTVSSAGALKVYKTHQREKQSFFRKSSMFREVSGRYAVILADPPWQYQDTLDYGTRRGGATNHYQTMSTDDLCTFKLDTGTELKSVPEIADDDSILFLWTTSAMLPDALRVMEAWGFSYKTMAFVWVKRNNDGSPFMGNGFWTRSNAEFCLLGGRGKGVTRESGGVHSIVETMKLAHSEKPAEIRSRIISLVGNVPRIELFARHRVKGWDSYGDQLEV